MSVNNTDKLIAQINTVVSGLDVPREDKLSLLVLLTEIGYEFKKAADAIEELTDNHVGKWIPVTERLPEIGEYVLCFCRANIVCVLRRDKDGDWYENPTHVYMSGFVTHWMPLPEPPEKESEP